jgi:Condensation domain
MTAASVRYIPVSMSTVPTSVTRVLTVTLIAIGMLTRRHAILRSTFHEPNGIQNRPFVAEHDPSTAASTLHIVQAASTKQAAANLLKMLRCSVDLSTHFAMRWIAVISAKETEVYVVSHHIALDGSSMSQLSVEFFDILAQLKNGEGASAPQTLQFSHAHIYEVGGQYVYDWYSQLM